MMCQALAVVFFALAAGAFFAVFAVFAFAARSFAMPKGGDPVEKRQYFKLQGIGPGMGAFCVRWGGESS